MIQALALIVLSAASTPAVAASAAEEFARIAAAHSDLGAYELHIDASVSSGESAMPLHAVVKCDGHERCLRLFQSSTTLETPALSLMVDSHEQTITVTRRQQLQGHRAGTMDPATALQTWLDQGGRLSGGELTPAGRHWRFASARPGAPTGEMYVDAESRRLRRLVYESDAVGGSRATVDISYTWTDPEQSSAEEFQTSRFVEERDGAVVPVHEYAHYRVISGDGQ